MSLKRINPKSLGNLKPRFAPDQPGETVVIGVRLRKDQREKLDNLSALRGLAIGVLVREAIDNYLSQPSGTGNENQAPPDNPPQAELLELLDTALSMTKAKDIKAVLKKMRERLTK